MIEGLTWDEQIAFDINQKDVMIKHLQNKNKEQADEIERLNSQLTTVRKQCNMWYTKYCHAQEKLDKRNEYMGRKKRYGR